MSRLPLFLPYKVGDFESFDKKWEKYRRMRIFTGNAYKEALNQKEIDNLIEI